MRKKSQYVDQILSLPSLPQPTKIIIGVARFGATHQYKVLKDLDMILDKFPKLAKICLEFAYSRAPCHINHDFTKRILERFSDCEQITILMTEVWLQEEDEKFLSWVIDESENDVQIKFEKVQIDINYKGCNSKQMYTNSNFEAFRQREALKELN